MAVGGLNAPFPWYWTWGIRAGFEIFLHGTNWRLMSKIREKNCGTLGVCCAVKFSKKHFTNLAYQSRGTGDAIICDGDDGRLWSHNSQ